MKGDHPQVNNNNKSLSQVATPYKKTTTTKPSKRSELRPKNNNAKRKIQNTGCPQNRGSHPLRGLYGAALPMFRRTKSKHSQQALFLKGHALFPQALFLSPQASFSSPHAVFKPAGIMFEPAGAALEDAGAVFQPHDRCLPAPRRYFLAHRRCLEVMKTPHGNGNGNVPHDTVSN